MMSAAMKGLFKISALLLSLLALASCGGPTALYDWGGEWGKVSRYEDYSYKRTKTGTPADLCRMICLYESMVNDPGGVRKAPAPGICAEYAYLLLSDGVAATFDANASEAQKRELGGVLGSGVRDKAIGLFKLEMQFYPESRSYVEPILRRISQ